jgi:transposase InsO family protein
VNETPRYRDDESARTLALFRYGVIAPVVERETYEPGERSRLLAEIARATHYLPGTGPVRVGARTIYMWMAYYRSAGIEALRPRRRCDAGTRRVLSDGVLNRAVALRKEQAKRKTRTLLDILEREGAVDTPAPFSRATLDRHLRRRGASRRQMGVLAKSRTIKMAFKHFGDLWVGDYHHGPLVRTPSGGVTTSKLGAFIDHKTRYPVADRYYLSEDLATLRDTLLRALLAWGVPKVAYVDRGSVYRSHQLAYSLHRVGCRLVHSRAYYSEGRGVIERWWQVAGDFEDEVRARSELPTIHELNSLWEAYRQLRYLDQVHSALRCTPSEAVADLERKPLDPSVARELFLVGEKRVVHKKDGCVSVLGRRFLCESFLRGERVEVRFDPRDLSSVLIFQEGKRIQRAPPQPVNAHPEAAPRREAIEQSVDYLGLVRRDYDEKLLEHARPLAYADLSVEATFSEERFLAVASELAGLDPGGVEREVLCRFWHTFGPVPEDLVRIGVEHAVRMHGRGRHVHVYLHAIKTLVLAHWKGPKEDR